MKTDWLKTRQTKYGVYVTLYVVIVVAVIVVANWLGNRHNKSYDATSSKKFSLSDQTEKVVKNLKQDVTITYWDQTTRFQQAKDLLDRYDTLSTKLKVNYIDPYKKPQLAREAGVKTEGAVILETGLKKQEARSLSEEEVTGALIRLLKGGERTACFVTGLGEHGLAETNSRGYSQVKDLLEKNNYKTQAVNLLEKPEVPKECTVLIVGGPKYDYPEPVINAIRNSVQAGGRAMLLMDPPLQMGKDQVSPNKPLEALLESWGVTLGNDLVLDTSGVGGLFGLGPEVPLVTTYETHPIVREMKDSATALALARSLEVKSGGKATVEKLFSTSANSYATTNLTSSPIRLDPGKDKKGPFVLAAAGNFDTGQQGNPGRFVVVGSSDWVANSVLRFAGNRDMFLNMMNWLSSDEDLISIRPKEPEDRRLTLNRNQMGLIRVTSQFLFPLIIIMGGAMVWWRRR